MVVHAGLSVDDPAIPVLVSVAQHRLGIGGASPGRDRSHLRRVAARVPVGSGAGVHLSKSLSHATEAAHNTTPTSAAQALFFRVVYFGTMAHQSIEERIAVHGERLEVLREEVGKNRDNIHKLQTGHVALELLARQVDELREELPHLARRAAREAVSEFQKRRRADALADWRTYAALVSAGAALGGLIVALILGAP